VTLANLRLIRDVALHHSLTKAARLCDMSQSAASQAVQEVERELDVILFDRSKRPLTVTPAGKLYIEYCRDMLRRHEELEAKLNRLKLAANGTARLAAIYSVGLSDMADIEARFGRLYPEGHLAISYLRPEKVWQAVLEDQADIGLMSYAESSREIIAVPWRDEEMVVAVAPTHPLAERKRVRAEFLNDQHFIGFDDNLPIQKEIERYLRDHRVNVNITLRFDNIQTIKEAVAHGAGLSMMPRRVMRDDLQAGRLAALQLDPPKLFRPVRIVHRRRKVFNEVTKGLLRLLRDEKAHAA
jgi:LysR family transcriptional regulator, transcriptional activator of the cysJI operon